MSLANMAGKDVVEHQAAGDSPATSQSEEVRRQPRFENMSADGAILELAIENSSAGSCKLWDTEIKQHCQTKATSSEATAGEVKDATSETKIAASRLPLSKNARAQPPPTPLMSPSLYNPNWRPFVIRASFIIPVIILQVIILCLTVFIALRRDVLVLTLTGARTGPQGYYWLSFAMALLRNMALSNPSGLCMGANRFPNPQNGAIFSDVRFWRRNTGRKHMQ